MKLQDVLALACLGTLCAVPAFASQAGEKTLTCTTGRPFEVFKVTLDYSHFDAGSGYFDAIEASYLDNYLTLEHMSCAGNSLDELGCVGYAFGIASNVDEVTLVKKDGKYFAKFETLKGDQVGQHEDGTWACTVSDQ